MSDYKPPFQITDKIISLIAEISEQVGRITVLQEGTISPHLRRENRIRTIHASLAIEHNSLSLEQITAILNGKRVLGNPNEIREVQNAYAAYELMLNIDPLSVDDLLNAHARMMVGLVPEHGRFRSGGVGIFNGKTLVHMAPPASFVPEHIHNLFAWYRQSKLHPLVKSAVFHYEFEFIHPFSDGNGRMARLWQTVILSKWKKIFEYIPIESQIEKFQEEYYDAIAKCHINGESTVFIEFMLSQLDKILDDISIQLNETNGYISETVKRLLDVMEYDIPYTSKTLMEKLGLKSREGFRKNYLSPAIDMCVIKMTDPDTPRSRNQRYIRV